MKKKRRIHVTDHALLRFLERVGGFDIDGLRRNMASRLRDAAATGAPAVVIDGHAYCLTHNEDGSTTLTTVLDRELAGPHMRKPEDQA